MIFVCAVAASASDRVCSTYTTATRAKSSVSSVTMKFTAEDVGVVDPLVAVEECDFVGVADEVEWCIDDDGDSVRGARRAYMASASRRRLSTEPATMDVGPVLAAAVWDASSGTLVLAVLKETMAFSASQLRSAELNFERMGAKERGMSYFVCPWSTSWGMAAPIVTSS